MKSVLYITNIEVPYRTRFFNEFAKHCNLTVLYERKESSNRDAKWSFSEHKEYRTEYLKGKNIGVENAFSINFCKYPFKEYDIIILGCFNSPYQMFLMLYFRIFKIKYILNLDGEIFVNSKTVKGMLKKFFLKGTNTYLVAGSCVSSTIQKINPMSRVIPYYFSSLNEQEVLLNSRNKEMRKENEVLVVGQYFDYKGLDILVEAIRQISNIHCTIVGTGKRTNILIENLEISNDENITVIPFLSKKELNILYQNSTMLVLPSKQECWGLVINEAASFGLPIVSTWGSGAAVEFISQAYPQFLARPDDIEDLKNKIIALLSIQNTPEMDKFSEFLVNKTSQYTVERMVQKHCEAIENTEV